jgi:murein DD-endopeptidase MepM/ murein hydrolase activator NlpD
MSNQLNALNASSSVTVPLTAAASAKETTSALIQSFEQLLTASLMSSDPTSSLASGDGSSNPSSDPTASLLSGSGSSSMDSMSMMLPMMLSLIEQLLSQQVAQNNQEANAASTPASANVEKAVSAGSAVSNAASSASTRTYSDAGASAAMPHGRPVGGVLTQGYHPGHTGLDLGVPIGTPVKTTMDGKVIYAGWNTQGYGNLVIVENGPYRTYYGHLSSVPVKLGEQVSAGSVIGLSGSTGNSTGPHLHYEIRRNLKTIDPTSVTLG